MVGICVSHVRFSVVFPHTRGTTPLRGFISFGAATPGLAEYRSPWAINDAAPRLIPGTPTREREGQSICLPHQIREYVATVAICFGFCTFRYNRARELYINHSRHTSANTSAARYGQSSRLFRRAAPSRAATVLTPSVSESAGKIKLSWSSMMLTAKFRLG